MPSMRFPEGGFQGFGEVFDVQPGVQLGRVQVLVPEQALDVADIGAVSQEMRPAGMAETVDGDPDVAGFGIAGDPQADLRVSEAPALA
jgi:hypothetical protein